MARKKVGKQRLDKYYHLAKDSGFRARSSFKLQQLQTKYNFLKTATSVIDLCAAPGGWLQVCMREMPVHRLILGIDLAPIRPLDGVTTFVGDITTDDCFIEIKRILIEHEDQTNNDIYNQNEKEYSAKSYRSANKNAYDVNTSNKSLTVDVVLHDGAPNVGTEWSHDAYNQSILVLHALKLASSFLRKDGVFVTKVFRSENFSPLLWAFNQLFSTVDTTKPLASRGESAEIYVVCRGFIKPDKISGDLFNPELVFKNISSTGNNQMTGMGAVSLKKMIMGKNKFDDGYDDNFTFYKVMNFNDFLTDCNLIRNMVNFSKIDVPSHFHFFFDHEILALMNDLKIININDFKKIVKKRDRFVKYLKNKDDITNNKNNKKYIVVNDESKEELLKLTDLFLDEDKSIDIEKIENEEDWKFKKIEEDIKREKRKLKKQENIDRIYKSRNKIFDLPDDDFFEDKLFENNFKKIDKDSNSSENEEIISISKNNNLSIKKKKTKLINQNKTIINKKGDIIENKNNKDDESDISDSESYDLQPNEIAAIIDLKKNEEDFIEKSIDRHCHDETNLPDWYLKEEREYNARIKEIEPEQINKKKEKKEIEAIQRRKKRALRIVQKKIKSGKNGINNEEDERILNEKNKSLEDAINDSQEDENKMIKKTYKKMKSKPLFVCPKNGKIVVPRTKRKIKLVDKRMKKDLRAMKRKTKSGSKR